MPLSKQAVDNICGLYREAKDKAKQIPILADLNATTEEEIRSVLKAQGYGLPGDKPPAPTPGKKNWPKELRKAAIRDLAAGSRVADVAAKHGVPQKTVQQWKWQAKKSGALDQLEQEYLNQTAGVMPEAVSAGDAGGETPAPEPAPRPKQPATDREPETMQEWVNMLVDYFNQAQEFMPGTAHEQEVIERYLLRLDGFVAGVEWEKAMQIMRG